MSLITDETAQQLTQSVDNLAESLNNVDNIASNVSDLKDAVENLDFSNMPAPNISLDEIESSLSSIASNTEDQGVILGDIRDSLKGLADHFGTIADMVRLMQAKMR